MSIIIGFQILIALPFVLSDTSAIDYINRAKFLGGGRDTPEQSVYNFMASNRLLTIFWHFVDAECYENQHCLYFWLRHLAIFGNIYHFFIRKGCLKQCVVNLLGTFGQKSIGMCADKESEAAQNN